MKTFAAAISSLSYKAFWLTPRAPYLHDNLGVIMALSMEESSVGFGCQARSLESKWKVRPLKNDGWFLLRMRPHCHERMKLRLSMTENIYFFQCMSVALCSIIEAEHGNTPISPPLTLDFLPQVLKRAAECSRERRRFLRLSSSNLNSLGLGPPGVSGAQGSGRGPLSDSSPAIDRLCERVEREVWGGGGGGSAGRLMRRQKSELDAGVVLRRQLHYASQKRLNRHSSEWIGAGQADVA